jgi:hypothetical protein
MEEGELNVRTWEWCGVQWRLKESKCTKFKSFFGYVLHKVVLHLNLVFFEILFTSSMLTFVSKTFEKPLIDIFFNI